MEQPEVVTMAGKKIHIVYVDRMTTPYPPVHHNMVDTPKAEAIWKPFLAQTPLSDPRSNKDNGGKHYPVSLMDKSKAQYLSTGENVFFRNRETGRLIGGVIENVMDKPGDDKILEVLTAAIIEYCNNTTNTIRNDDPGYIVSAGYTSGSRNKRALGWARNLRAGVDANEQAQKIAAVFALIHARLEPLLPEEVVTDFANAREKLGGLEMHVGEESLKYSLNIDGKDVHVETSKFAPASGQCGINYSRYTHNEKNANEYCYSFNTERTHPEDAGGNFYIAEYGILIPNRKNQMKFWQGEAYHGTSLLCVEPSDTDPPMKTIGVSFILSKSLAGEVKRKVAQGSDLRELIPGCRKRVKLGSSIVKPRKRQLMIKRTILRDRSQKEYVKTKKYVFHLPEKHPYKESSGKLWSKEKLLAECGKRYTDNAERFGSYGTSWSVKEIIRHLLEHDGIAVSVEEA